MNFTNLIIRLGTIGLFTVFFWRIFKLPSNFEHEYKGCASDNSTTSIWDKLINFLTIKPWKTAFHSDQYGFNMEIEDNRGFRSCTTNHISENSTSAIIQWSEFLTIHFPNLLANLTNVIKFAYYFKIWFYLIRFLA